jgi:hypothetical protein
MTLNFKNVILTERFNPIYAIEINKQPKEKVYDMFRVYQNNDKLILPDIIKSLDPKESIIFSMPSDNNILFKRNITGSISLCCTENINLTNKKIINNAFIGLVQVINLKISVPRGVMINFKTPSNNAYFENIYSKYDTSVINDVSDPREDIYTNMIYTNFKFSLYINLEKFKKENKTIMIKKGSPFCEIYFTPIYFIGSIEPLTNITNSCLIQDPEIYKTFEDIFDNSLE